MVHHAGVFKDAFDLGPAPALLCAPSDPAIEPPALGFVLLLHSLGGAKEESIDDLERFARAGFCALAPDAIGHGARWSDELQERLDDPRLAEAALHELVADSAREVRCLIDEIEARGWLGCSRVGLVGYSFGADVALAARPLDTRIAVVVSIAGSPPRGFPDKVTWDDYWPAALLLIHGEDDELANPALGARFVSSLRPHYAAAPTRLEYTGYEATGHLFPHARWERAMESALEFLSRHLPPS